MDYFEDPRRITALSDPARKNSDVTCFNTKCSGGPPGTRIPIGTGYLYISHEAVDFRQDARTLAEWEIKFARNVKVLTMRAMGQGSMWIDPSVTSCSLLCEKCAHKQGIDLKIAAADAKYWWKTGLAPLRATPVAKRSSNKPAKSRGGKK